MSKIISGKVKKIPSTDVSDTRYNFLSLSEAEPDLGVPQNDGYVLVSNTDGTRSWSELEDLGGFGSGFRYIFDGYKEGDPGQGNISFFFSVEVASYVAISKITNDNQNVSEIIKILVESTGYPKSYVILKSLEPSSNVFFAFKTTYIEEYSSYYRVFFDELPIGQPFSEGDRISFDFSVAGDQGTAVTILGSYADLNALEIAHPIGSVGDSYITEDFGTLYVWNSIEESWLNVGVIRGPQGPPGPDPLSLDGGTSSTLFI